MAQLQVTLRVTLLINGTKDAPKLFIQFLDKEDHEKPRAGNNGRCNDQQRLDSLPESARSTAVLEQRQKVASPVKKRAHHIVCTIISNDKGCPHLMDLK